MTELLRVLRLVRLRYNPLSKAQPHPRETKKQPMNDRPTPAEMAKMIACLDCDADITILDGEARVFPVTVEHDETCPWYQVVPARWPRTDTALPQGRNHPGEDDPGDDRRPTVDSAAG